MLLLIFTACNKQYPKVCMTQTASASMSLTVSLGLPLVVFASLQ